MQAEIISIGDELLIGQTINTNSAWLGEALNKEGIRIYRATSVADIKADILSTLKEAAQRSDLILITGGLGPTKDDITKIALCEYFDTELVINEEVLARVTAMFASRNLPMLEVNKRQAEMPKSCTVIPNERGTASGMWFEKDGVVYISMPGVPYEMEHLMEHILLKKIREHFLRPNILHRTVLTFGVGESFLAQKIEGWEDSLTEHKIGLAYLPSPGMVKLRMSAYDVENVEAMKSLMTKKEDELISIIGEFVYGYEKDTLQSVVGDLLRETNSTLSIAESCTGGYISHLITSIPGSSDFFQGGFVTYAEEQKVNILGVSSELIENYTVLSNEVAEAMAAGAREKMNTTWAISTTGVAGPTGGTKEIPVGTVWIGIAGPKGVKSIRVQFGKRRELNILQASNAALNLLRKEILS